jgi:hypothetical protein
MKLLVQVLLEICSVCNCVVAIDPRNVTDDVLVIRFISYLSSRQFQNNVMPSDIVSEPIVT